MTTSKISLRGLASEQRRALYLLLQKRKVDVLAHMPIERVERDVPQPLSGAQRRLYVFSQLNPQSSAYHIAGALRLRGRFDQAAAERALEGVVARHEALRTTFVELLGVPHQRISALQIALETTAVEAGSEGAEQALLALATAEIERPFDLQNGPLLRARLLRLADDHAVFVLTLHHIVADAWSLELVLSEFCARYEAALHGRTLALPEPTLQYVDYACFQREWLEVGERERQLGYYRAQLSGLREGALALPSDRPRPALQSHRGATLQSALSPALSQAVKQLAQAQATTPFVVLLGAFKALLYRHTGERDLTVGVPVANRERRETHELVGFFVNTQVLRSQLSGRTKFVQLVEQLKQRTREAQQNRELPFDELVDELAPARSLSHNPLFQVMFNHLKQSSTALTSLPGLSVEPLSLPASTTQFDLTLDTLEDERGELRCSFEYAVDLFERESVARMQASFVRLLEAFTRDPNTCLGDVDLVERPARTSVARGRRGAAYEPVHVRIREQAARRGAALALTCGEAQLSYEALEQRVHALATQLVQHGAARELVVGVAAERTLDSIVAMLAVWRAGAAFVPLDLSNPSERLQALVEDAAVRLLVVPAERAVPAPLASLVRIHPRAPEVPTSRLPRATHPEQLAYVLFTSGSTGRAKPVAVSHGALALHVGALASIYELGAQESFLQFSSFSFDASLEQWLVPLSAGARVVIRPDELWSAAQCAAMLTAHGITRVDLPPAYAQELVAWASKHERALPLISCTVGGEALARETLQQLRSALPNTAIYNAYGPTEAVVTPLLWRASGEVTSAYAPIGRPLAGRTCYVLDSELQRVPDGVVGELYLGGEALARGYAARPAQTSERFLPDPFGEPGARLYRTGDRARVRADGVIEYVGRDDRQVKLRGFRIELGEVEAQLLRLPHVREAFACLREQPTQLVAYVAADGAVQASALLDSLAQTLPAYMLPAQLSVLPSLPRTTSGKVDARALLALRELRAEEQGGEAPRGALEQQLAQIFADVLGQERVARDANFFQLGGDSIVSLQLVSRAREQGLSLTPRDVFQHQTVRALARVVRQTTTEQQAALDPAAHGALPLTPIQRDFFRNVQTARHHYNQSVLLKAAQLDATALASALAAVVQQHAALRLRFTEGASHTQNFVSASEARGQPLLWERRCEGAAELLEACEEAQRSLDLARGPLLRALHARMADGSSRLLLVVHHLAVDGVSWRILLEDLATAYAAYSAGRAARLPRSTSDFGSWAKRLSAYASSDELASEHAYWATHANESPGLLAPRSGSQPATSARVRKLQTRLNREQTSLLLREAHAAYRTQGSELLLAALVHAVHEITGSSALSIEVEGHGRDERFADIDVSRTVGWFTTLYPLALRASPELGQTIVDVKEQVRSARAHALSYGVLKELAHTLPDGCVRPHLTFNYLGQFDGGLVGEHALFQLAEEARGSDQDPNQTLGNGLEINGQVFAGVLTFTFSYGEGSYDDALIARLARAYERALAAVAEHGRAGVLRALTPSDFPLARLTQEELSTLPFAPSQIEDVYPLTPMQQGLLFHSLEEAEAFTYVNQLDVEVAGLDPARLAQAFQRVLARHAILRTAVVWQGGLSRPVQVVTTHADADVEQLDLSVCEDQAEALSALRAREHTRGFVLERPPLLRLVVAKLAEDRHQLLFTSHHLLLDGWSNARLIGELLRAYAGELDAAEPPAFRDYIAWLEARPTDLAEQFWREKLTQLDEPTYLASSISLRERASGHGRIHHTLAQADAARLAAFGREQRVTLNTLVQAAWAILLSAYTGKRCVSFGTTVAGRPSSLPGSEQMLGLFINTLPSVQQVDLRARVVDFLRSLQDAAVAAREHEHTPLYTLQRWAGQPGRPLFDSLLVFENYPTDAALAQAGSGLRFGKTQGIESTNYPLSISVVAEQSITFGFEYDRAAFDEPAVQRLAARFVHVLIELASRPDAFVYDIGIVTPCDAQQLARLTPAARAHTHDGFVHERIAQLARFDPAACAVTSDGESLSFAELDAEANRLAHRLVALGVAPERRVGIALERSPRLFVALLAVLKAGGCYVPLDPSYPSERLALMQEDGELMLLITSRTLASRFEGAQRLLVDDEPLAHEPVTPPRVALRPEHAAYMIYTSGSTGRPKGVVVAHAALSMHCQAARELYGLSKQDCALHLASISFDAAVEQWLVPLLSGARLLFDPDLHATPERLLDLVERERVTLVYPPTSHLLGMAQLLADRGRTHAIRLCTVGGEAVSRDTIARLRETFTPERIINGYGPTEAVITPLLFQLERETVCSTAYAPIGSVVGSRSAWVLGPDLKPQPPGVIGELYIGGAGLARGYHRRAALTAERFLPDPYTKGGRMYRTGDLVRMLDSGDFEYIGRVDQQIKLRGFRIEPGEIEAALLTLDGVHEAAVLVETEPVKRLLAYVAGTSDEHSLLEALRARLPEHMVPARVVVLERMPRTPNGKVDRKVLPAPELRERAFSAATNESERQLSGLFADVLGLEKVGRDDNFFELGGDSIVSIQFVSRARKLGLSLTPRQIFQHPTPRALAEVVRAYEGTSADVGPVEGEVALTPIQAEFFALALPTRHHFNQSLLLRPRTALDLDALARALTLVARHHDALRLRYREEHGKVVQHHLPSREFQADDLLWCREATASELEALCQAAQQSLDLQRGPVLRALYVRLDDGSERLLLVVHHLVVDGVSFRILLEDLDQAYRAAVQGATAELVRTSSFQAWSAALLRYAHERAERDLPYWEHALRDARADLPRDHSEPPHYDTRRDSVRVAFDRAFTERLLRDSAHAYRTRIDELLLTALARALCSYGSTTSVLIELEGHGREELERDLDTSRTLGWFTTSFPVQLTPEGDERASIIAVKEQLRAIPDRGLSFGVLKYLARSDVRERMHAFPRPDVSFNYLGQFDQSFGDPGALFVPAAGQSGDEHAPDLPLAHSLAIGGEIYGGELRLTFGYAPARHERATVERLAASFREELSLLVEHCTRQTHGILTPTDVPFAALDFQQLTRALAGQTQVRDVYRLTPMQEGMLFHALAEAEAGHDVYVTQLVAEVSGLDVERFRAAWQATLDAHDTLRTSFVYRDLPHPVQRVHGSLTLPFVTLHERDLGSSVAELAALERKRGFALDAAPLLRITLIERADQTHQLIWTSHHLLLDGWSSSLLFGEVLQRYHGATVEPPRARFADYIGWLSSQDAAESERFFRTRLSRLAQPTMLSSTLSEATSGHGSTVLRLAAEPTRALVALAQAEQVTLHTVVQAALIVLLQRITGQRTVAFGSTVSGRPAALPEVEQLLGLFINTLPVIAGPSGSETLGPWLRALQADALALREHEHTPLYEIQRWAGFGGALFDCLLVFENFPVARALGEQCGQLSFRTAVSHETTNYPLTIGVTHGETLDLTFDFQRERFELAAIERIRDAFEALLLAFVDAPTSKLGELALSASPSLSARAPARAPTARLQLVHEQIALQAERTPHKPALVGETTQLSYGALQRRSASVARAIRDRARAGEVLVGVALERSPEALAALLGVLRAGATFVVLDPSYPVPYLRTIVERSSLRMVIGRSQDRAQLTQYDGVSFLALDQLADAATDSLASVSDPDALAYLLYTSGSTGAPKGVEVSAGALARQCEASAQALALDEHDQQLLFSSLAFDASLEQWLVPLTRGATVHVMAETWSPTRLLHELTQRRLTRLDLPPAYALTVARELEQTNRTLDGSLRSCTVGGEAIAASDLARILERLRPARAINAYGPTEAVITPTAFRCTEADELPRAGYAPIGAPLAGRRAYVLDAWLSPLPDGVTGELYLGGEPLARGYRAEPARTSERFVPDPFVGHGARMLRTGDLVRKRADGVLEFVGRSDEQLKIRGFRVELGEVQTALQSHPGVHEAAVIAQRQGSDAQLLAYAVAPALQAELLLAHLRQTLPAHAVPAHLSLLDALPRTSSGKLDARALPTRERAARVHVAPRNAREQQLAAAFADVLELAQVSIYDNFFELGGHSLRALSLLSQIERHTGERVRLADILANPSVESLARRFDHAAEQARSPLVRLNAAAGEAPLFCMHPAGGAAFAYTEVARELAAQRPVYGLVCRSLLDAQFQDRSLAEMGEDYALAILSVQATGPFSMLGWSLGGAVALSVAAALEARGHRVSFLGFVDGFVPGFDDPDEGALEPPLTVDPRLLAQLQEREQAERTLAHLTELSRTFALPRLDVAPHCWWSNEGRSLRGQVLARLAEGLGQRPRYSLELEATHEQIVRHPEFLTSLRQELARSDQRAAEAPHAE